MGAPASCRINHVDSLVVSLLSRSGRRRSLPLPASALAASWLAHHTSSPTDVPYLATFRHGPLSPVDPALSCRLACAGSGRNLHSYMGSLALHGCTAVSQPFEPPHCNPAADIAGASRVLWMRSDRIISSAFASSVVLFTSAQLFRRC